MTEEVINTSAAGKKKLRDAEILKDYYMPGATAKTVALKHGVSVILVRKVAAGSGIVKPKGRAKESTDPDVDKSLSPLHKKIGVRFTGFLFQRDMVYNDAVELLGWSVQKISSIGKGRFEVTLTDLAALAEFMEITPSRLLEKIDLQNATPALADLPKASPRGTPGTQGSPHAGEVPETGGSGSDPH